MAKFSFPMPSSSDFFAPPLALLLSFHSDLGLLCPRGMCGAGVDKSKQATHTVEAFPSSPVPYDLELQVEKTDGHGLSGAKRVQYPFHCWKAPAPLPSQSKRRGKSLRSSSQAAGLQKGLGQQSRDSAFLFPRSTLPQLSLQLSLWQHKLFLNS